MYLKFKLVHAAGKSFFLIDGLIDDSTIEPAWYTPQFFSPPILQFVEDDASARVSIDFVGGQRTLVKLHKSNAVSVLPDGAFLSACTVENPQSLQNAASVRCVLTEGTVWLWLFHHTKSQWRDAILESGHFRASTWNLRGTRQLQNISYLYLTSKPHIRCDRDLADIAMANDGALRFLRDGGEAPQDILTLEVYRDSTLDRDATLPVLVASHSLSSPPLWFHPRRAGNSAYYEVVQPAVHRVGTRPDSVFPYSDSRLGPSGQDKAFGYAVVGDASTDYGITAPYDEEETRHIMQLESPPQGWDVFDMWKALANLNVFNPSALEHVRLA